MEKSGKPLFYTWELALTYCGWQYRPGYGQEILEKYRCLITFGKCWAILELHCQCVGRPSLLCEACSNNPSLSLSEIIILVPLHQNSASDESLLIPLYSGRALVLESEKIGFAFLTCHLMILVISTLSLHLLMCKKGHEYFCTVVLKAKWDKMCENIKHPECTQKMPFPSFLLPVPQTVITENRVFLQSLGRKSLNGW